MRPLLTGLTILAFLLGGCSREPQPTLASGKPVSYWLGHLQDPTARVRRSAVNSLGSVGRSDAAVVPALTSALKDPDPTVRSAAILALLKCDPAVDEAMPALVEMQQTDESPDVRSYAARALEKLRGGQ
jgi:HEAT repeat protein